MATGLVFSLDSAACKKGKVTCIAEGAVEILGCASRGHKAPHALALQGQVVSSAAQDCGLLAELPLPELPAWPSLNWSILGSPGMG